MASVLEPAAPRLESVQDALDLIGDATYQDADWVAVRAETLSDTFFDLSTRLAGDVLQKFVQYGRGIAIVGDISARTDASTALREFVGECNRGRTIWFVRDRIELEARLAQA